MSPNPESSPDSLPKNWHVMVVSMVISGCTVLLLISYYSIILRLCSRFRGQPVSRNRAERRFLNESNPDDPSLQFHSHGLDSSVVNALPVVQFKIKKGEKASRDGGGDDCAVCLGDFEDGDWIKHLPNCTHVFHVSCIDTWFQSHSNCPLCRSNVFCSDESLAAPECPVSMRSLLETLRREDFFQERARHYQMLRSDVVQSIALRHEAANVT